MLYRGAITRHTNDYAGKSLKGVNRLIISNKSQRDKKLKEELNKEKIDKDAWKKTFVPSYFQSEWGKNFLEGVPNKESNFLQTSEHDFINNGDENSLIHMKKKMQIRPKMDEPPRTTDGAATPTAETKQKKPQKSKENQENKSNFSVICCVKHLFL